MKKPLAHYIFLILTILLSVVIFLFSADNADESGNKSDFVTKLVLRIFIPSFREMGEDEQEALVNKYSFFIRKAAHFSEYALLGFLAAGTAISGGSKKGRGALYASLFSFLYAVSDELHQKFVGGRYPSPVDVAIDTVGAVFGVAVFLLVVAVIIRFSKNEE